MVRFDSSMKYLLIFALGLLLHAAYSAAEWRSVSRKLENEETLPLDISIQTLLGLALAMIAVVNIAGAFKEIRASVELSEKTWETQRNRPSFYVYNHRGRAFSPNYEPVSSMKRTSLLQIPEKFKS